MLKGTDKGIVAENIREAKKSGLSEVDAIKLVSMKNAPKKKSKKSEISCCGPDGGDAYPYGLRLDLNNESLDKLGIKGLPASGKVMKIVAEAKVESTSERQERNGDKHRSVGLQITSMSLK